MIVNIRLDVTDAHRNQFSRTLHPKAERRLATREEYVAAVKDFVFVHDMLVKPVTKVSPQVTPAVGIGAVEITQPGPSYAVETAAIAPADVEKHGTGIQHAPEHPTAAALFHVNRAMFALGDLQRISDEAGCVDSVNRLVSDLLDLRQDFVERHDSERGQEWNA